MLTGGKLGFVFRTSEAVTLDLPKRWSPVMRQATSGLQGVADRAGEGFQVFPRVGTGGVLLIGDQVAPVLTGVDILSNQPAHQRLGSLTLGGVIAAALVLALDDPIHPVGVQGYEVRKVAVFRVIGQNVWMRSGVSPSACPSCP